MLVDSRCACLPGSARDSTFSAIAVVRSVFRRRPALSSGRSGNKESDLLDQRCHFAFGSISLGETQMIFAAMNEAADRDELLLVDAGLCRFHLRRDGVVTIREILVLPLARRCGVGRRMVNEVQRRHPHATLRACCPVTTSDGRVGEANVFWRHLGFVLQRTTTKGINVWERQP